LARARYCGGDGDPVNQRADSRSKPLRPGVC